MQSCRRAYLRSSPPFSPPSRLSPGAPSREDSSKELPDAATLLQESSETTKSQTSVHLKLTVQGEIKELPIESLEGDLTNAPAVAAQGKANLLFLGQKLDDVGFVVADGNLFATLTTGGAYQDFGPAADIYDVSAILNPDTGLANVLANFTDPKADGRETVNGVETVRVTGNVSADAVNKIAPQIGATGPGSRHRVDRRGRQPRAGAGQAGAEPRQQRHDDDVGLG